MIKTFVLDTNVLIHNPRAIESFEDNKVVIPIGVIEELDLVPGTVTGESSASVFFDMMPLDTHLAGSAHSHPNGVLRPSGADVNFFPRAGRFHLIIGYPYREGDWKCFSADGEPCRLEVVA